MAKEELEEVIEYEEDYIQEQETLGDNDKVEQDSEGQVKFKSVNHHKRAEANEVESDGEIATYANYALEYFGYRCALSGEKFVVFDNPVERENNKRITTNLSAEHVVALTSGGNDIIPNVVPSVYQYNIQKNGYYILDWWPKAKDIKGNTIYSPEKLLKIVNYMLKSLQARKDLGIKKQPREYRKRLLTPNEIDEFLSQEDIAEKLLSDTITATTKIEDGKNILTQIPQTEGEIPSLVKQKDREIKITETMFLIDAIKLLEKDKKIPQQIINELYKNFKQVENEIPFEVAIRNYILKSLELLGLKENIYSIANELLINSDIIKYSKVNKEGTEEYIHEYLNNKIEHIFSVLDIDKEDAIKIIITNPAILYNDKELKSIDERIKWIIKNKEFKINIDQLNSLYLSNTIDIKIWMEKNGRKPRSTISRDGENLKPEEMNLEELEEYKLGNALRTIKTKLIEKEVKIKDENLKREYKEKYPELEIIKQIIKYIDVPLKIQQLQQIKDWMKKNQTEKLPSSKAENAEEKRLANIFNNIKNDLVKPYLKLQSEELKQIYRKNYPELDDVMQLMLEIDVNPRTKTGKTLNEIIKQDLIRRGKLEKDNQNKKDDTLEKMQRIVKWMKDNNSTKPPRAQIYKNNKRLEESELSDNQKEEKRLGNIYANIKNRIISPYEKLETEEEKNKYKIYYPNIEEIIRLSKEIEKNNNPAKENQVKLKQVREIKEWMEKNKTETPPSSISKDEEEKKLGIWLSRIRQGLITPYTKLNTTREQEEYRKKHPELEDVMAIVVEIDKNNVPIKEEQPHYINILAIRKWMEDNNTKNPPSRYDENKTVSKLGIAFSRIRQELIKPYQELESEDEKEEYKRKHPELEEVMAIVEQIDMNNPKNKKKIKDTVRQNKDNLSEAIQVGEELEAEVLMAEKVSERSASDGRGQ